MEEKKSWKLSHFLYPGKTSDQLTDESFGLGSFKLKRSVTYVSEERSIPRKKKNKKQP